MLAHTFEPKVATHSQAWKQKTTVDVETYLNRTNNGYFLIVDEFGDAIGWIDMNHAAFWDQSMEREGFTAKEFYNLGAAALAHGTIWASGGVDNKMGKRTICRSALAPIWVNDFLSLAYLKVQPKFCTALDKPHAKVMQVYQLRNVVGYVDFDDQNETTGHYDIRLEWKKAGQPTWEEHPHHGKIVGNSGKGLIYDINNITERWDLKEIYHKKGIELSVKNKSGVTP
jgi:hypothetical protein